MTTPAEQEVLDVQRAGVWGAIRSKDPAAWDLILAPDFVLRSPGEDDRDRDEFVERFTGFPGTVESIACHDLRADEFGDAVVVTGVQHAVIVMPNGARLEDFSMMTNVFVRHDGRWRMALTHALSLPM